MQKEILIVEDERALASSLARAIEQMGYACRVAHDGTAALDAVAEAVPDAILLDLLLPKKDGYAVMEALSRGDDTRNVAVIAMSGVYRGRDQEATILQSGGKAFLAKPFSTGDLKALLVKHAGRPEPTEAEAADVQKLPMSRYPVALVLWEAMAQEFNGALHFQSGKKKKVVVFQDGRAVAVRSNLAREALGRRLLDVGRIDQRVYDESMRRNKATGKPQGEILVEMGALTKADLDRALAEQAEEKMLALFSWTEGESWRQEGVRNVTLSSELKDWTPQKLILRGVVRTPVEALLTALAAHREARVERGPVQVEAELADGDVRVLLEAIGGPQANVAHLADLNTPALYGLWLCGVLRFKGGAVTDTAAPTPPPAEIQLERELDKHLARLAEQDHFDALGVTPQASPVEVRKAFFALAKHVHPDKLATGSPAVREKAAQIFARLSQAHETLIDAEAKKRYIAELKSGGSTPADPGAVQRIMNAESQFKAGEEAIKRKDWPAAIEAIQGALELEPDEGEYHALLGWALFMASPEDDESARNTALETLKKAASLAPKSPTGYYYLGQVRKACGDMAAAEKMFRKVIELRPKHAEAISELRLIGLRKAKGDATAAGKRFGFGRKK